jgi:FkbM family methyltransferase
VGGGGAFSKFVVIDIGSNIGDTPIFFAGLSGVEKVYAFEPFKIIFDQAQFNFSLNSELAKKIEAYNFGLSNEDLTKTVGFNEKFIGSNITVEGGVLDAFSKAVVEEGKLNKQEVVLKSADKVISEIISKTQNEVVLKIDCEGAEYEILKSLSQTGTLKKINAIMLEWHFRGEQPLLDILSQNNFVCFSQNWYASLGMIYAVRVIS